MLIDKAQAEDVAWREATRAAAGIWKDRSDLEEAGRDLRDAAKRRFASVYEHT